MNHGAGRIHFLQDSPASLNQLGVSILNHPVVVPWSMLCDPAVEEALYESISMRSFAGINLGPINLWKIQAHQLATPRPPFACIGWSRC